MKQAQETLRVRLTCDDLSKELLRSVSEERHTAHQELVQDDAHGPPVNGLPIALAKNHLWSDVLRGPAHLSTRTETRSCTHVGAKGPINGCFGLG